MSTVLHKRVSRNFAVCPLIGAVEGCADTVVADALTGALYCRGRRSG